MDDAFAVDDGDGVGRGGHPFDTSAPARRPPGKETTHRLALQELQHNIGRGAFLTDVVDGNDIGVGEGGDGARLVKETCHRLRIRCQCRRQDFDGDVATEPRIMSTVNLAHSAGAEHADDFVATEVSTGLQGRRAVIHQTV